jgi:hypothetical protein
MTTPAQPWWLPFLGPGATVIAAGVAGWLAYRLQQLQAAIGKSQIEVAKASQEVAKKQADIAFDKLKLDLFNRRLELYNEAKKMALETVNGYYSGVSKPIPNERLDRLHEAAFIFSAEAANQIKAIRAAAEKCGVYSAHLKKTKKEGSPQTEAQEELIFTQLNELTAAVNSLREAIKHDMSFVHLLPKSERTQP